MVPILDQTTVVLAGAWNPGIFSPDWVSERLFDKKQVDFEFAFAPLSVVTPRLMCDGVLLVPQQRLLTLGVTSSVQSWKRAAEIALSVVSTLGHTPITAVGINFGWETGPDDLPQRLSDVFKTPDGDTLILQELVIESREITRGLKRKDHRLNLKHSLDSQGKVRIHFNFHKDCFGPAEGAAKTWLTSALTENLLTVTTDLAREVYGLEYKNDSD